MERQEGRLHKQVPICLPQQKLLQQELPMAAPMSFRGGTEPSFRACTGRWLSRLRRGTSSGPGHRAADGRGGRKQRGALNMTKGLENMPCVERLKELALSSPESREGEVPEAALLLESHHVTLGVLAPSQQHCPLSSHRRQGEEGKETREKKSTLSQQIPVFLPAEPPQPISETTAANPMRQKDSRPQGEGLLRPSLCPAASSIHPASTNGHAPRHPCPQRHQDLHNVT